MEWHTIITDISHSLSMHPYLGYSMAVVFAFLESLAVVGSIIPGAITMTALGTLVGSGILLFWPTVCLCIVGALIGDYLSYYIGLVYQGRLASIWPISRFPHWLTKGRSFFDKYGVAAIIIGRFFGPVRSMIPLIAGMLNMNSSKFIIGIIPSATLWSIVYLTPGIILGALSTSFPADVAIEIMIDGLLAIVAFWAIIALINAAQYAVIYRLDYISSWLWRLLCKNASLAKLKLTLDDPLQPNKHHQLYTLMLFFLITILFIVCALSSHQQGFITALDLPLYHFSQSLRTPWLNHITTALAVLSHHTTLFVAAGLLIIITLCQCHYWRAFIILLLVGTSSILIKLTKLLVHHPRPESVAMIVSNYSFPSGHVALATALLLFLCMLMKHHHYQRWLRIGTWFIITLLACSRLILGVHWLSDVLGGVLLGLMTSKLMIACYQCRPRPVIDPDKLLRHSTLALFIAWGIMMPIEYHGTLLKLTPTQSSNTINHQAWWQQTINIGLFRDNRFGYPIAPFNCQVHGGISQIIKQLSMAGWVRMPAADSLSNFILRNDNPNYHMPLFNLLHQLRPPALIMVNPAQPYQILRLWRSNFLLTSGDPIYIGTVNQIQLGHHRFMPHLRYHLWRDFHDALGALAKAFPNDKQKIIKVAQSTTAQQLHWNRKIILIDLAHQSP